MSVKTSLLTVFSLIALLSPSLIRADEVASDLQKTNLCTPPMEVRFSCAISNDNRRVSICADGPHLKLYLGKPGAIEIELPRAKGTTSIRGWFKNYRVGPEEPVSVEAELTFQDGALSYTVANTLYDDKRAGYEELIIREGEKIISRHRCDTEAMNTGYVVDLVTAGRSLGLQVEER